MLHQEPGLLMRDAIRFLQRQPAWEVVPRAADWPVALVVHPASSLIRYNFDGPDNSILLKGGLAYVRGLMVQSAVVGAGHEHSPELMRLGESWIEVPRSVLTRLLRREADPIAHVEDLIRGTSTLSPVDEHGNGEVLIRTVDEDGVERDWRLRCTDNTVCPEQVFAADHQLLAHFHYDDGVAPATSLVPDGEVVKLEVARTVLAAAGRRRAPADPQFEIWGPDEIGGEWIVKLLSPDTDDLDDGLTLEAWARAKLAEHSAELLGIVEFDSEVSAATVVATERATADRVVAALRAAGRP